MLHSAVLETLFPKFEDAGIEKLMFRSMQPKPAVDGVMAAGSLMVKPAVFHSSICKTPSLLKCVVVYNGNSAIVSPSASSELPETIILVCAMRSPADWAQVRCTRRSCTKASPAQSVPCQLTSM